MLAFLWLRHPYLNKGLNDDYNTFCEFNSWGCIHKLSYDLLRSLFLYQCLSTKEVSAF
jgi:hypothetical protein